MSAEITQVDVDEALSELDVLVNRIDDQRVDTISGETDAGVPVTGRVVQHGTHVYQLLGSPQFRHIKVQASFDAAQGIAADMASDGGQAVQPSAGAVTRATSELRDRVNDDDLGEVREGLINRLSTNELVVQLHADDEFVTGFDVEDRLFAYDRDITVAEFYDEVQSVINGMWRGKEFLLHAYDLLDTVDENGDGPRGFQ